MAIERAFRVDEPQRQLVLLALATLALERPGFDCALSEIALLLDNPTPQGNAETYEEFKRLNGDKHAATAASGTWAELHRAMDLSLAAWVGEVNPPGRPRLWETGSIMTLMKWLAAKVRLDPAG